MYKIGGGGTVGGGALAATGFDLPIGTAVVVSIGVVVLALMLLRASWRGRCES